MYMLTEKACVPEFKPAKHCSFVFILLYFHNILPPRIMINIVIINNRPMQMSPPPPLSVKMKILDPALYKLFDDQ